MIDDDMLVSKLRYMGRQYASGQRARGGGPQGPHYLEDAADRIGAQKSEIDALRSLLTEFVEVDTSCCDECSGDESRCDSTCAYRRARTLLAQGAATPEPLRAQCAACHGTGMLGMSAKCLDCDGAGLVP